MKTLARIYILILTLTAVSCITGCSSFGKKMKSFLDGDEKKTPATVQNVPSDNMKGVPPRQYGRMTRARMEQEAQLGSHTGSLWVNEGQGSYLFAENTSRLPGDLLNVKLDGAPREQLQTKARVIRDLIRKIERQSMAQQRAPAGSKDKPKAAESKEKPAENAEAGGEQAAAGAQAASESGDENEKALTVEVVPTRVIERLPDGNYRVEGSESFMIGKREYQVLVAGIVRPQDFNDDGLSSTRLLDPRFDIISAKKGAK